MPGLVWREVREGGAEVFSVRFGMVEPAGDQHFPQVQVRIDGPFGDRPVRGGQDAVADREGFVGEHLDMLAGFGRGDRRGNVGEAVEEASPLLQEQVLAGRPVAFPSEQIVCFGRVSALRCRRLRSGAGDSGAGRLPLARTVLGCRFDHGIVSVDTAALAGDGGVWACVVSPGGRAAVPAGRGLSRRPVKGRVRVGAGTSSHPWAPVSARQYGMDE